jgi:hypothetical protein
MALKYISEASNRLLVYKRMNSASQMLVTKLSSSNVW